MLLKLLVELLIAVMFGLFMITQIIVPAYKGTRLFWAFRRNTPMHQMDELNRKIAEEKLRQEVEHVDNVLEQEEEVTDNLRSRRKKKVI